MRMVDRDISARHRPLKIALAIFAASTLVVLAACRFYGAELFHKLSFLRLQSSCMDYDPPADYPVLAICFKPMPPVPPLTATDSKYLQRTPLPRWDQFRSQSGIRPITREQETNLFLHSLRSKSGNVRLVSVDIFYADSAMLAVSVIEPGTFSTRPRLIHQYQMRYFMEQSSDAVIRRVANSEGRFFAGHHDHNDTTHFAIPFIVCSEKEILDGWLGDDDMIELRVRDADKVFKRIEAVPRR